MIREIITLAALTLVVVATLGWWFLRLDRKRNSTRRHRR